MIRQLVLGVLGVLLVGAPALAGGPPSWSFMPGRYSHDPHTGARVAQYAPPPAVPAFPDSRPHASGYLRTRVNQRGADGTISTYYQVENWSNRPDRIDAEWERYNDVWQRSVISASYPFVRPYGPVYTPTPTPGFGFPGQP